MADELIMKIVVSVLMLGEMGNEERDKERGITAELKHELFFKQAYTVSVQFWCQRMKSQSKWDMDADEKSYCGCVPAVPQLMALSIENIMI